MFDHSWITLERKQLSFLIGFLFSLFYVIFVYFFQLLFSACFVFSWEKKNASANNSNIYSRANPNPDVGKSCSRKSIDPKLSQVPFLSSSICFFFLFEKKNTKLGTCGLSSKNQEEREKKKLKKYCEWLGTPLLSETLLNYMLSLKDSAFDKIVSIKIPRISIHLL